MTRSQSRQLQSEYPIGDAYRGPAYGEKLDPVTATIGGLGLVGGYLGSREQRKGAESAANISAEASRDATAAQERMFERNVQLQEPWRQAGMSSLKDLLALTGQGGDTSRMSALLQATPGYQFRMDQGQKALERSAAARGGLLSGRQLMAQQRFGQGLASDEMGNYWNRLASLAGVGQTATNNLGAMGANTANTIGNIGMTNAANMGNAALAGANARGSFYQGLGNTAGQALGWSSLLPKNMGSGGAMDYWGTTGYSDAGF